MKIRKFWKVFLLAMSVIVLPLALVGVGQAQQMTCWGLASGRPRKAKSNNGSQCQRQQDEDIGTQMNGTRQTGNEKDTETAAT
jgi:hypothetical protein